MSDITASLKGNQVPPETRAKLLARVYAAILSWPDPREKNTEPVADDLGGEAATSSADVATTVKAVAD